jgi:poly-gamma-glutamate synthesis protein (capsule biosynthesis protein)
LDIGLAGASNSTLDAASRPYVMQMGNYKVALLSAEDVAAYYWFEGSYGTNYYSKKASTGGVGMIDKDKISSDIAKAGELADIVIVMMSWGSEYTNHSNAHQQALAHAIVDAGADMIVGSHPHWVQEIEVYKGKPIVYSLGNFIFDQTDEGLMFIGQDTTEKPARG